MLTTSSEICDRALDLISHFDEGFLELANLLRRLQEEDHELFKQFLSIPELGRRKGYYLVAIDRAFEDLPIPRSRLTAIGWTKLHLISRHVTAENFEELLQLAETHKAHQLDEIMRGGAPSPDDRTIVMYFSAAQYKVFEKKVLKNGAVKSDRGLARKEPALIKALSKTSKNRK